MSSIIYPSPLKKGSVVGVTAPSAGISSALRERLNFCVNKVVSRGFEVKLGECLLSDGNIVSASVEKRAHELRLMLSDKSIEAIVPPWGGELLVNLLPHIDFPKLRALNPKWIVGYSDISTFLMPYTMLTGIATLHGSNFMETGHNAAEGHVHWLDAMSLKAGSSFKQTSAKQFQTQFTRYQDNPNVSEWNYKEPVEWKVLGQESSNSKVEVSGRLIGGCVEVVGMLPGSPYGDVNRFAEEYAPEGLLVYLEICEEKAPMACRLLHHLKLAGWFKHANGILVGRTQAPDAENFTQLDAIKDALGDLGIPVIYDMDIGHVPPQLLLVNGSVAKVRVSKEENSIVQTLC